MFRAFSPMLKRKKGDQQRKLKKKQQIYILQNPSENSVETDGTEKIETVHRVNVKPITPLPTNTNSPSPDTDDTHSSTTSNNQQTSTDDVPKLDSGVRMLCLDGGGAKGVIEATVLDKVFLSVSAALSYEYQVMNWLTLVITDDKKDTAHDRTDNILRFILTLCNSTDTTSGQPKRYKQVKVVDRSYNMNERRKCLVISGLVDNDDAYRPFTHKQKLCLLKKNEELEKAAEGRSMPGLEIKDFLHGASKYWVFINSDGSEETRKKVEEQIKPFFVTDQKKKPINCCKLIIPAMYLAENNQDSARAKELDGRDLLLFYWDEPVKTKHAQALKDNLLNMEGDYAASSFLTEIHATDMFDLLIGTSTGSILAFGMGYKGLSPQECRDIYLKSIKKIFSSKYDRSTGSMLPGNLAATIGDLIGDGHYALQGVKDTLVENYGVNPEVGREEECKMGGGDHRDKCICACVALNWESQSLEPFDTHNERFKNSNLIQFLSASSDAPVYFTTPSVITAPRKENPDEETAVNYIDGGLGANCPAVQGIDVAKERWKGTDIDLIIAIGAGKDCHPPELPKNGGDWLKRLCTMVTDGDNVWSRFVLPLLEVDEACKHTEKQRIQPRIPIAKFKADSIKVIEMCQIAEAWLCSSAGFLEVTEAAGKIIAKSLKLEVESRTLTEQDLTDWLAQTLPIGKKLYKNRHTDKKESHAELIMDEGLDMKFGRDIHSLTVRPVGKLREKFPGIDKNFIYIPKPVSVGQTDLRFTLKLDHYAAGWSSEDPTETIEVLKLHCPDNHKVNIFCNLDLFDSKRVFKIGNLVTVPLEEIEQFHRLVHEASKEISQLCQEDRENAERVLCKAMDLSGPQFDNIYERYPDEHFMRVQAYFYLWKNMRPEDQDNLQALNETLIKVGMKKRPWPMRGKLGVPDVTVRTVIPAPPENMMFSIAYDYFSDRLEKATEKNNKENIEKYQTFLRHLGTHPAKRDAEGAKFKKKLLTSIFNTGTKKASKKDQMKALRRQAKSKKVKKEPSVDRNAGEKPAKSKFRSTAKIHWFTKKSAPTGDISNGTPSTPNPKDIVPDSPATSDPEPLVPASELNENTEEEVRATSPLIPERFEYDCEEDEPTDKPRTTSFMSTLRSSFRNKRNKKPLSTARSEPNPRLSFTIHPTETHQTSSKQDHPDRPAENSKPLSSDDDKTEQ